MAPISTTCLASIDRVSGNTPIRKALISPVIFKKKIIMVIIKDSQKIISVIGEMNNQMVLLEP
jgi:hypothetical protein